MASPVFVNTRSDKSSPLRTSALSLAALLTLLAGSAQAASTSRDETAKTRVAAAFFPNRLSRPASRNVERNRSKVSTSRVSRSVEVSATVVDNETLFTWPETEDGYARIRFTQNGREVVLSRRIENIEGRKGVRLEKLISRRMNDGRLGNDYMFFNSFEPNQPVRVEVSASNDRKGTYSPLGETEITPVVHQFDSGVYGVKKEDVRLSSRIPSRVQVGGTVEVSGSVKTSLGLRAEAHVVSPKGFPQGVGLETSGGAYSGAHGLQIAAGQEFRLAFTAEMEGTYIVEVNNYEGIAVINQPVYVGSGVPLVPNTLDAQGFPAPGAPVDAAGIRAQWIGLINRDRAAFGLDPVELDEQLTASAQAHIDDMAGRNYFSHIGLDGSTPSVRAKRAGVSANTMVGENIGQGMGIEDLEAQLMASAAHRGNVLNPNWKRVGLGIGRYSSGLLVGAQEFGATAGEYSLSPEYFAGVKLDRDLPSGLSAEEKITLSGKVTRPAQKVQVFFTNKKNGQSVLFSPALDRSGRFQCSVKFNRRQAGLYTMGISLNGAPSNAASVVVRA